MYVLYLLPEVFDIDEKVIYIKVPEGYQVCRHNGKNLGLGLIRETSISLNHSELNI